MAVSAGWRGHVTRHVGREAPLALVAGSTLTLACNARHPSGANRLVLPGVAHRGTVAFRYSPRSRWGRGAFTNA
jgi:hypothetical protein